jgi:hypothetical protein
MTGDANLFPSVWQDHHSLSISRVDEAPEHDSPAGLCFQSVYRDPEDDDNSEGVNVFLDRKAVERLRDVLTAWLVAQAEADAEEMAADDAEYQAQREEWRKANPKEVPEGGDMYGDEYP